MYTAPPPSSEPKSTVELFISCSNLKNKDLLSKSDPLCEVKIGDQQNGGVVWSVLGRTEMVLNNRTFIV